MITVILPIYAGPQHVAFSMHIVVLSGLFIEYVQPSLGRVPLNFNTKRVTRGGFRSRDKTLGAL